MTRSLGLFAEVALIGVLVCVASAPLVTSLGAVAAGSSLLGELLDTGRTPTVRRFLFLLGQALRAPTALLVPAVLFVVGFLDVVALLGGVPGGPVIGLALLVVSIVVLRGAARWTPGASWAELLADPLPLRDWRGSALVAVALVVLVVVVTQAPAFVVLAPGLLVLATAAVARRIRCE
jgi:hypothetical protein